MKSSKFCKVLSLILILLFVVFAFFSSASSISYAHKCSNNGCETCERIIQIHNAKSQIVVFNELDIFLDFKVVNYPINIKFFLDFVENFSLVVLKVLMLN